MTDGTIAIVANTLGAPSETFVRRHVETLCGGRTVAICRRVEDAAAARCPHLVIGQPGQGIAQRAGHFLLAVRNQLIWGGIALPNERTRDDMVRFLRDQRVRCILAEFGPSGCIVQSAASAAGIPLFVYFRGRDASSLLRKAGVRRAYRALFPRATGIVAVSRFLLDNLRTAGFAHPNAHVIPSGVDTDAFVPGEKDPRRLLWVGRFVPKKAPELVVRAMAALPPDLDLRLDMIGAGPLLEPCRRLAHALGCAERIRFLGVQPHAAVRTAMAHAAIFLQHSVTAGNGEAEGLPSSIQEAMAAGAAVVATRHAGIPEAIASGSNGLLVAEGDLEGFVTAIGELAADPVRATRLAAQARRDAVARFDNRRLIERLEGILLG